MISSLVEWIENMDEWELKLNILRFIGTVIFLFVSLSKLYRLDGDLRQSSRD